MNLSGSKSRLNALTRELSLQWDDTRTYWRDAKSQEFEQRYLRELFAGVEKTITVIDQLDQLLAKVRNDCE
jgi:hypothetical protein